jgi:hypothetical protein
MMGRLTSFWKGIGIFWRSFWKAIQILWLIAVVATLVLSLLYHGPKYRDAVEAEAILMAYLTFPSGIIAILIFSYGIIDLNKATDLQQIVCIWLSFFAIGYIQWFILVPWIVGIVQRKRKTDNDPPSITE